MRIQYFGDSYDIVKRSLLAWLAPGEAWAVHPMFTEVVTEADATAYSRFLGAPLVSRQILGPATDRVLYFGREATSGHLFLDPNTGVRVLPGGARRHDYLYLNELVGLVRGRSSFLTLVFDQSIQRGAEKQAVVAKLEAFAEAGVRGFAYISHACFLVLSGSGDTIQNARRNLLERSRLPANRIIDAWSF